ncbi:hypothetical protein ARMGADRAFT_1004410 [Armillaria gallica]|uniref:Uncharacterized protein n=1 Tax=Armillaria gallica TaxID=47427 RepID=A0A2H3EZ40_ARMGA|nr:hypothetical protein ARMGADRAFT_1004410 [Armillaria gallica]
MIARSSHRVDRSLCMQHVFLMETRTTFLTLEVHSKSLHRRGREGVLLAGLYHSGRAWGKFGTVAVIS